MAKIQWNEAQRAAIDFRGKNLLLSAAAGSGKTATLTERILDLIIREGDDLSKMLIVTFTRDAAAELKQKIAKRLTEAMAENPEMRSLERQIQKLEGAAISTTHSFLLNELKPHFVRLALPPDFSVGDDAMLAELRGEIMLDVVNDFFEAGDAEFVMLADTLSGARDDEMLDAALLSVWDKLMLIGAEPEYLLNDTVSGDFLASNLAAAIREEMYSACEHYTAVFDAVYPEINANERTNKYAAGVAYFAQYAKMLTDAIPLGYTKVRELLGDFNEPDNPRLRDKTDAYVRYMGARKSLREDVRAWSAKYFSVSEEELSEELEHNRRICRALYSVIGEFEKRFSEAKRERGRVDYNDLERLAVKLFVAPDGTPTPEAVSVGAKFDHIFIDEYQDTNRLQDLIYTAIAGQSSRFMVGDIKQSIYGFRGARPEIFRAYRELYDGSERGSAIFMSENHRCDEGIIDFSNLVSDHMFKFSETPFEDNDRLVCAKSGGKGGDSCEVVIIRNSEELDYDPEAEYIADRIERMIAEEKLRDGSAINASDIAILSRDRKNPNLRTALERRGIAVASDSADNFFERSEVLLLCSLLYAIDNPTNDIHLCALMKSPIAGFSMSDLINMRGGADDPLWYSVCRYASGDGQLAARARAFTQRLNGWREAANSTPVDKFVYMLITETGFRALHDENGGRLQRSIRKIHSYAVTVSRDGGSLHDLIRYIEGVMASGKGQDTAAAENAVTICTIHASKGLEYPVCFIAGLHGAFKNTDSKKPLIVDPEDGVFMKLTDEKGLVKYDTPLRAAAALKTKSRNLDEEMRILYVAMTRARERLIMTYLSAKKLSAADISDGIHETTERELVKARARVSAGHTKYAVRSSGSLGHFVLDTAVKNMGNSSFELKCEEYTPQNDSKIEQKCEFLNEKVEIYAADLQQRFAFEYSDAHLADIPAKLPVSKLSSKILDGVSEEREEIVPCPNFISGEKKADAAAAGTATHLFMQFCDLSRLELNGAEAEAKRLTAEGFITAETAELIRLDEVETFSRSALATRMRNALEVNREFRFNAMLPAWEFTERADFAEKLKDENVEICVQGVIDCLFKDADGKNILVDYKTDRLTPSELDDHAAAAKKLTDRHGTQLLTYKRLAADMLGEEIDEVLIYSLHLGDTIRLT